MISYYKKKGMFWFRIFGKGLSIENRNIHPPRFSIKSGIKKELRIFNWAIEILP